MANGLPKNLCDSFIVLGFYCNSSFLFILFYYTFHYLCIARYENINNIKIWRSF